MTRFKRPVSLMVPIELYKALRSRAAADGVPITTVVFRSLARDFPGLPVPAGNSTKRRRGTRPARPCRTLGAARAAANLALADCTMLVEKVRPWDFLDIEE